jgi:hypothetical protein
MHTRPNRPHQKKKKRPDIAYRTRSVAKKMLSTHISNDLTQVSVSAEDRSNMPLVDQHFSCPLMPLADQYLHAQSCPSWTSTFVPIRVLQAIHEQPKSHK